MIQRSFTGNVINPIIDARLRVSLTSNALAKKLGLSRQYLSRAEQGTYNSLNPALLKWVGSTQGIAVRDVEKGYRKFQEATREATMEEVNPHRLERHEGNTEPGHVLFERWRSGYWTSPVAFGKAFCLHSDTIDAYEEGLRRTMPEAIRSVLLKHNLIDESFH